MLPLNHMASVAMVLATGLDLAPPPKADDDTEPPRMSVTFESLKAQLRSVLQPTRGSKAVGAPTTGGDPAERCKCCGQPIAKGKAQGSGTAAAAATATGEVVVIRMSGSFDRGGLCESISPFGTDLMLDLALERKPTAIILDIDSGGGYVTTMKHVVERLLKVQVESKVRVIAWPGLAGSAAAVTCMACREIIARPTTKMGAATKIDAAGNAAEEGETALDMKMKSVEQALWRQIAQITGHDPQVLTAMQQPDRKLWYKPGSGFRDTTCEGAIEIDSSDKLPATFNAQELVDTKLAAGTAASVQDVLAVAHINPASSLLVIDLCDPKFRAKLDPIETAMEKWWRWQDKQVEKFMNSLKDRMVRADKALQQARRLDAATFWDEKAYESLRTAIGNCKNLPTVPASVKESLGNTWDCIELRLQLAQDQFDRAKNAATKHEDGKGVIVSWSDVYDHLIKGHGLLEKIVYRDCD
jgi:hypothetical protein